MNFESNPHFIAFIKVFGPSDTRFNWDEVESIFRKEGRLELGFPDPNCDRDHTPAIRYHCGNCFNVATLLLRDSNEEPGSGTTPEQNLAAEFEVHSDLLPLST